MADIQETNNGPNRWNLLQISALCFFSSVGYWGFTSLPYYVYTHTGLFFFAFYTLLVLICIPVCYVQIKLGALYRKGLVGIFGHLVPILKGVAAALLIMTYFRSITHALEISYGVFYMFASTLQPFPWTSRIEDLNESSRESKITIFDDMKPTPENSYFIDEFLKRSPHIGSWGPLVWYLVLCVLAVWVAIYLMILKGSAGFVRLMSVLAPATGTCAMIVLVYGYSAIPGASASLHKFFTESSNDVFTRYKIPIEEQGSTFQHFLSRPKIWMDALELHIYGLGLWAGILPFIGTHISCKKKTINLTWIVILGLYSMVPHLLLVMLVPYIDPKYPGGTLSSEVGIKTGMYYLFVAVPHTFSKYNLSPFIGFMLYLTYVLVNLQHLAFHSLMIWENIWPSLPKSVIVFFRRIPFLLAAFCFFSFILSAPYAAECGIYLYQIIRYYVDRLLFALIIFSMVPFVIGFIRQETLRTPIDRIFMGVWYALASVIAACLCIYNFVVFVYPRAVVEYEQRWAEHVGWCVSISPLLIGVLLGGLHALVTQEGACIQRILGSLRAGGPASLESRDDFLSIETGDTDLKSPCPSRQPTPMTQARAPLLQNTSPLGERHLTPTPSKNHTLFTAAQTLSNLPKNHRLGAVGGHPCINSPTGGREPAPFPGEAGAMSYGTLQATRGKAEVEVVIRSNSDGNVARL